MPTGKWIAGLSGATPLSHAARKTLRTRLRVVSDLLRAASAAAASPPHSPPAPPDSLSPTDAPPSSHADAVHQLRVSTRRAAAAVRALAPFLRRAPAREARRVLSALRRAAADARDCDVHAAAFRSLLTHADAQADARLSSAIRAVLERLAHQRALASRALRRAAKRFPRSAFAALADALRVRRRFRAFTLLHAATSAAPSDSSPALLALADSFADAANADLTDIDNAHAFRIATKRLRYALEVFAPCFPDALRSDLYPRLVRVQETLGQINDAAAIVARLRSFSAPASSPALTPLPPEAAQAVAELADRYHAILRSRHERFLASFSPDHAASIVRDLRALLDAAAAPSPPRSAPLHDARPPAPPTPIPPQPPASRHAPPPPEPALPPPAHSPRHAAPKQEALPGTSRRLAAIDVGTNSIRLIIAEVLADGSYRVIDDEKEVTRLGRGLAATGTLDPEAMHRSAAAVARMHAIAKGLGADLVRAIGTCAVREATNAPDFVDLVRRWAGIAVETISAEEEARLSFLSASHAFDLSASAVAVVDIGGGSTEIVVASAGVVERVFTIPLGAVKLTESFDGSEASSTSRYLDMRRAIRDAFHEHLRADDLAVHTLIGAGGTLTTLGNIALQRARRPDDESPVPPVQGKELLRSEVRHLLEYIRKTPLRARARIPGLSPERADIIVAGIALVDELMKHLNVNRLRIHDGGVRDGLLLTMMGVGSIENPRVPARPRDRMRAVRRFASSCGYEEAHCAHVARLAAQLHDQLASLLDPRRADPDEPLPLWTTPEARSLLEAASLLHDVGYLINYSRHHMHTYHLVSHSDLPGFTPRETQIIALLGRYHRKAPPSKKHPPFAKLDGPDRDLVRKLSAILRLAVGLDRTHMQAVRAVRVRPDPLSPDPSPADAAASLPPPNPAPHDPSAPLKGVIVTALSPEKPEPELWGATRTADIFRRAFGLDLTVDYEPALDLPPDSIHADPLDAHAKRLNPTP